jgi:hypothetical protein
MRFLAVVGVLLMFLPCFAQTTAPTVSQEELDSILAPVALYPDSLLSQVLMASTYPLEVVQAQRWTDANKSLTDDALAAALEKQAWDASVKSLVNTPQILTMMSEKLDWTMKLGDAFLDQRQLVMETIQKLRGKAQAEGNLKSTDEQKVTVDTSMPTQIIIEQANPQVVYVPAYDPMVVYGAWWYPAYPPHYYYPPYYRPGPGISFGVGFTLGVAWGYAWGHCDWHHTDIDIDIDRNVNFNRNIDRARYKSEFNRNNVNAGDRSWQHDPAHRQGAPYRDRATANRYGQAASPDRQAYRGFDSSDLGTRNYSPSAGGTQRDISNVDRSAVSNRAAQARDSGRGGALDGANRSASQTRAASNRGNASRAGASGARGGGASRGGARGGGRGR